MFCEVVLLRWHGSWISNKAAREARISRGVLDFRRSNPAHYGRSMEAKLLSIRNLNELILPTLQYARVLTIKEGGVMIDGYEISFRATKSKPTKTRQTWWCVTEHEPGFEALKRMHPPSSTGFTADMDDDEDR